MLLAQFQIQILQCELRTVLFFRKLTCAHISLTVSLKLPFWLTMLWDHCINSMWFTDLIFILPDRLDIWWSCIFSWRCCNTVLLFMRTYITLTVCQFLYGRQQLYVVCGGCNVSQWVYWLGWKITWNCCKFTLMMTLIMMMLVLWHS